MARGRELGTRLVVSLFVNPAQFGPGEDLGAYPRNFTRDCEIAEAQEADALFAPEPESMYPPGHVTWVEVPQLAQGLCGKSRPTHFRGVCTVVLKLLNLVRPDFAVFGEKDWQQLAIIRAMVRDLDVSTAIISVPIVRESDGLALSSRNVYLNEAERRQAPAIQAGLKLARDLVRSGEQEAARIRAAVLGYWQENLPDARLDYLSFVHPETLAELDTVTGPALLACAVFLGRARLIDNILL